MEVVRIELSRLFGPGEAAGKTWRHRVIERVSKLNRLGGRHGVSLRADWTERRLVIRHPGAKRLEIFRAELFDGTGAVQRALALALETGATERGDALKELARLQLSEVPAGEAFVDSPYRAHLSPGTPGPLRSAAGGFLLDSLRADKPFHGWVLSEPGGGKTALLDHVFRECCRLYLSGDLPYFPVLLRASETEARQGRLWGWSAAADERLRGDLVLAGALLELERAGKLIVFVDGLDENAELSDVSNINVLRAWQSALRGRCVMSCRSRFYALQLEGGSLERLAASRTLLSLSEWGQAETRALFRRLAARAPSAPAKLKDAFAHLAELPPRDLVERTAAFRKTPLNLRLYSRFVAGNRALYPRNEYELLEFVFQSLCRWQTAKRGRALAPKAAAGLLTRLAWEGYAGGRARRFATPDEVARLLAGRWPDLNKEQALAELESNPLIERDAESGVLSIDPHFTDFLAARQLVQTLLLQDSQEASDEFSKPVLWDVARCLDEATELLGPDEKRAMADCLIGAFKARERAYARKRDFSSALALNQLGYQLGKMGDAAGSRFLRGVIGKRTPAARSEMCYWAICIGLALAGDAEPLGAYVDRLEKTPRRPPPNMAYCQLYYLDKRVFDGDLKTALEEVAPTWEKSCDRLLSQLASRGYAGIRVLDLFLLRRFIEVLGPAPLRQGERLEVLRRLLPRVAADCAGEPRARAQLERLEKTLSASGL